MNTPNADSVVKRALELQALLRPEDLVRGAALRLAAAALYRMYVGHRGDATLCDAGIGIWPIDRVNARIDGGREVLVVRTTEGNRVPDFLRLSVIDGRQVVYEEE